MSHLQVYLFLIKVNYKPTALKTRVMFLTMSKSELSINLTVIFQYLSELTELLWTLRNNQFSKRFRQYAITWRLNLLSVSKLGDSKRFDISNLQQLRQNNPTLREIDWAWVRRWRRKRRTSVVHPNAPGLEDRRRQVVPGETEGLLTSQCLVSEDIQEGTSGSLWRSIWLWKREGNRDAWLHLQFFSSPSACAPVRTLLSLTALGLVYSEHMRTCTSFENDLRRFQTQSKEFAGLSYWSEAKRPDSFLLSLISTLK